MFIQSFPSLRKLLCVQPYVAAADSLHPRSCLGGVVDGWLAGWVWGGLLAAWLSVLLFLWMNDLTNVLGLLAQSSTLPVPVTVVLILVSLVWPVAMDLHVNAPPPVSAVPPALPQQDGLESRPVFWLKNYFQN